MIEMKPGPNASASLKTRTNFTQVALQVMESLDRIENLVSAFVERDKMRRNSSSERVLASVRRMKIFAEEKLINPENSHCRKVVALS